MARINITLKTDEADNDMVRLYQKTEKGRIDLYAITRIDLFFSPLDNPDRKIYNALQAGLEVNCIITDKEDL